MELVIIAAAIMLGLGALGAAVGMGLFDESYGSNTCGSCAIPIVTSRCWLPKNCTLNRSQYYQGYGLRRVYIDVVLLNQDQRHGLC